jgi:hypothetical protein
MSISFWSEIGWVPSCSTSTEAGQSALLMFATNVFIFNSRYVSYHRISGFINGTIINVTGN